MTPTRGLPAEVAHAATGAHALLAAGTALHGLLELTWGWAQKGLRLVRRELQASPALGEFPPLGSLPSRLGWASWHPPLERSRKPFGGEGSRLRSALPPL